MISYTKKLKGIDFTLGFKWLGKGYIFGDVNAKYKEFKNDNEFLKAYGYYTDNIEMQLLPGISITNDKARFNIYTEWLLFYFNITKLKNV